jgi:hypothetical protein
MHTEHRRSAAQGPSHPAAECSRVGWTCTSTCLEHRESGLHPEDEDAAEPVHEVSSVTKFTVRYYCSICTVQYQAYGSSQAPSAHMSQKASASADARYPPTAIVGIVVGASVILESYDKCDGTSQPILHYSCSGGRVARRAAPRAGVGCRRARARTCRSIQLAIDVLVSCALFQYGVTCRCYSCSASSPTLLRNLKLHLMCHICSTRKYTAHDECRTHHADAPR